MSTPAPTSSARRASRHASAGVQRPFAAGAAALAARRRDGEVDRRVGGAGAEGAQRAVEAALAGPRVGQAPAKPRGALARRRRERGDEGAAARAGVAQAGGGAVGRPREVRRALLDRADVGEAAEAGDRAVEAGGGDPQDEGRGAAAALAPDLRVRDEPARLLGGAHDPVGDRVEAVGAGAEVEADGPLDPAAGRGQAGAAGAVPAGGATDGAADWAGAAPPPDPATPPAPALESVPARSCEAMPGTAAPRDEPCSAPSPSGRRAPRPRAARRRPRRARG